VRYAFTGLVGINEGGGVDSPNLGTDTSPAPSG
jgi:hypothetical protein